MSCQQKKLAAAQEQSGRREVVFPHKEFRPVPSKARQERPPVGANAPRPIRSPPRRRGRRAR